MSKLNVDQKTIKDLFQDKKADFLIPDYQRPYAWGETECQTLWDDIFSFAIPDEGRVEFDSNSEYLNCFSRVQNKAYGNWIQNTEKTATIFPIIS